MSIIFLIGMFVIMYFFLIRPQVKRQKEHKAMVEGLKKGRTQAVDHQET